MKKTIAIIPARGGSTDIPHKNIRPFLGKPLLAWTVDSARTNNFVDRIVVSTDDEEIRRVALASGAEAPFLRPSSLATKNSSTSDVVKHAVDWLQKNDNYFAEVVLVLEPTSPGRQSEHITQAIELYSKLGADSIASISAVPHHYYYEKQLILTQDSRLVGITGVHPKDMVHRRQDIPPSYAFDGILFSCRTKVLYGNPTSLWGDDIRGFQVDACYVSDLDVLDDWTPAENKLRPILLGNSTTD